MVKNLIKKSSFVFVFVFVFISNPIYAVNNVILELYSDKPVYQVGENVNLSLKITNPNKNLINGQIRGKVIIGDIGYQIQCFDYDAKINSTQYLGLTPLPASLSNSNKKIMTTLYLCSGTKMQSTKSIIDNSLISQIGKENFTLGPFTYSYSINGTDYQVKSNKINILVISKQNKNKVKQKQSSNSKYSKNLKQSKNNNNNNDNNLNSKSNSAMKSSSNSNQKQIQSNQNSGKKSNSLSKQAQQSLTNSQQNAQSINQIKKQIQNSINSKNNSLKQLVNPKEQSSFWVYFFIIFFIIILSFLIYLKYLKKKEENLIKDNTVKKKIIPKYLILLDKISSVDDEKFKAKYLSQSIRTYIAKENNLDLDLTHNVAIKLTKNKLFIDLLKKTESIEFSGKIIKIDYIKLIKQIKGEFK